MRHPYNIKLVKIGEKMKEIEKMLEQIQKGFEAVVTKVEKTTSFEYFETQEYEDKVGYSVTFQIIDTDTKEPAEWDEFFAIPSPLGYVKSKVGLFTKKYGTPPKKGIKVQAEINEEGFFRVKL